MNVIDADGHIVEKADDIRSRMREPFNKRRSPLLPHDGMDPNMEGRVGGIEENDMATRLRDMDQEGIKTSVLFPTTSFAISQLLERDYATAYCQAYNDFVAEMCRNSPRLKAVALVPFQFVSEALAEINRCVTKLNLAAIAIASQGLKEHLGSQTFWPIYEEMERLRVPLCVHNLRHPPGQNLYDSFIFRHTVGRPLETVIQFVGMMYAGIPEKFPKLHVSFLECGVGWVPYWMERMDEEYEKRALEVPILKGKPSEYLKRGNWFFATEPEEEMLPYVIEHLGEDKVLFASDYPHWDGLFPNAVSTIRKRKDLPESAKKKILEDNAGRFYHWTR